MIKPKQRAKLINIELTRLYPDVECELDYQKPHELLIAARLSAQCTDKRVNIVTPALFDRFRDINGFAEADIGEVESFVHTCGLGKTKARDIVLMCRDLRDIYGGIIPNCVDELVKLSGIGRKTANLIAGELYGKPAVVTDTHVIRLSNRLGLVKAKEPEKVETELRRILPPEESMNFCHRLVWHGRRVCKARGAKCPECTLVKFCVEKG